MRRFSWPAWAVRWPGPDPSRPDRSPGRCATPVSDPKGTDSSIWLKGRRGGTAGFFSPIDETKRSFGGSIKWKFCLHNSKLSFQLEFWPFRCKFASFPGIFGEIFICHFIKVTMYFLRFFMIKADVFEHFVFLPGCIDPATGWMCKMSLNSGNFFPKNSLVFVALFQSYSCLKIITLLGINTKLGFLGKTAFMWPSSRYHQGG